MNKGKKLIRVFSGGEVAVTLLKGELHEKGIWSIIQNDFQSSITAGFVGGTTSALDLYIREMDFEIARTIIQEYTERNK